MTIGEQIKKARKRAGLTQQELSEAIGAKHSLVSRYEGKGKTVIIPPIDKLIAIADVLDSDFTVERITVKKSKEVVEVGTETMTYTIWKDNWPIGTINMYPWQAQQANRINTGVYFAPGKEKEE